MALITCSECGKQISDAAPACPHCGAPAAVRQQAAQPVQQPMTQPYQQQMSQPYQPQINAAQRIEGRSPKTTGGVISLIISIILSLVTVIFLVNFILCVIFLITAGGNDEINTSPVWVSTLIYFLGIVICFTAAKILFSVYDGCKISVTPYMVKGSIPFKRKMKAAPSEIYSLNVYGAYDMEINAKGKTYRFKDIPNQDQIVAAIRSLMPTR